MQAAHGHIGQMGKIRNSSQNGARDDRQVWRVVDDFAPDLAIDPAELDAVEAFLVPLVNAILFDDDNSGDMISNDSTTPQIFAEKEA